MDYFHLLVNINNLKLLISSLLMCCNVGSLSANLCEMVGDCPKSCACTKSESSSTAEIDVNCSELNLNHLHKEMPHCSNTSLTLLYRLDYSLNQHITIRSTDALFNYWDSVEYLDLSMNNISDINPLLKINFIKLKVLLLNNNALKTLPEEIKDTKWIKRVLNVSLHHNPWECECDNQWTLQWLTSMEMVLANPDNITCHTPESRQGIPVTQAFQKKHKCKNKPVMPWWGIVVTVLILSYLVVTSVCAICITIRNRHKVVDSSMEMK